MEINRTDRKFTVSATACPSYDTQAVDRAVRTCINNLGGIEKFVSRGETILLKPNMLSAREPDRAITTHPEIVRAAIRLVKEAGGIPVVGDTPSGLATESLLRNLALKTGIAAVCEEERVEFALLTKTEKVQFPQGVAAKSFEIAETCVQADGVISLAKLKTHSFTVLTGAVKNLFGVIPGLRKAEYHYRMQSTDAFSEMLVDLAECVRPRLTIMDGIVGMDGDGPSGGRIRRIGLVAASASVHALDAFTADLVGVDPDAVPTIAIARRRGLISRDPIDIEVVGADRTTLAIQDFRLPSSTSHSSRIPRAFVWIFGELFSKKPVFSKKRCNMCEECIQICPTDALARGIGRPEIDRSLCIRCYCCGEVCGQSAVKLRRVTGRSVWSNVKAKTRRLPSKN